MSTDGRRTSITEGDCGACLPQQSAAKIRASAVSPRGPEGDDRCPVVRPEFEAARPSRVSKGVGTWQRSPRTSHLERVHPRKPRRPTRARRRGAAPFAIIASKIIIPNPLPDHRPDRPGESPAGEDVDERHLARRARGLWQDDAAEPVVEARRPPVRLADGGHARRRPGRAVAAPPRSARSVSPLDREVWDALASPGASIWTSSSRASQGDLRHARAGRPRPRLCASGRARATPPTRCTRLPSTYPPDRCSPSPGACSRCCPIASLRAERLLLELGGDDLALGLGGRRKPLCAGTRTWSPRRRRSTKPTRRDRGRGRSAVAGDPLPH